MSKLILSTLLFIVATSLTASAYEHRPEEPYDFVVQYTDRKSAKITWHHPERGSYTNFWLRISSPSDDFVRGIDIPSNIKEFTVQNLKANTTYELEFYTMNGDLRSSGYAPATFTTLPNDPQEIYTSIITETKLTVHYNTSYLPKNDNNKTHYYFDITPKDNDDVVDYVIFDPVREYSNLIPGKLYTISVVVVHLEEDRVSNAEIIQVRTIPAAPLQSPEFVSHFIRPKNFHVSWLAPNEPCEFNHYHISTFWYDNDNREYPHQVASFYTTPDKLSHKFLDYSSDKKYTVEVRTVSFGKESKPLILQITKEMSLINYYKKLE
ncbi:hypothetical protein HCN44_005568 [Aphidius gifuensis]|uniref:Fibronectin type-III domain-containing protein n=1 Tax=Aphidius gifuensis TaxID=684658 RepID=A0A834Y6B4_APHGI|nr:hypothetical protein HCN44_005568 [Aphidius gifuensis]